MPSQQLEIITQMLRDRREQTSPDISFTESRAMFEQMVGAFPAPQGISSKPVDAGGMAGEWISRGRRGQQVDHLLAARWRLLHRLHQHAPRLARRHLCCLRRTRAGDRLPARAGAPLPGGSRRRCRRATSGCSQAVSTRRRSSSAATPPAAALRWRRSSR